MQAENGLLRCHLAMSVCPPQGRASGCVSGRLLCVEREGTRGKKLRTHPWAVAVCPVGGTDGSENPGVAGAGPLQVITPCDPYGKVTLFPATLGLVGLKVWASGGACFF